MNGNPTLLAVGAHPDDIEIGCAGSLLRWAGRYQLVFAIATDGERSLPYGVDRIAEAEKVTAGFGAMLERLALPDGNLGDPADLIGQLGALDARYRPVRVLLPSRHDSHQDHRALGRAGIAAFKRVSELLAYESHTTERFEPSYFVDISGSIERKCEILARYESQAGKLAISEEYVRTAARHRCLKSCHRDGYVEAFEVLRFVEGDDAVNRA